MASRPLPRPSVGDSPAAAPAPRVCLGALRLHIPLCGLRPVALPLWASVSPFVKQKR